METGSGGLSKIDDDLLLSHVVFHCILLFVSVCCFLFMNMQLGGSIDLSDAR